MNDFIFWTSYIAILISGFFAGGSIASFLGVVFTRIPKGESILGHSHCECGRPLKWYENVPVIGWLRIKGTAKCCGAKITATYFIIELLSSITGLLIAWFLLNNYINSF